MTTNELMIGDWVQGFVPDTYSRVVAIPYAYRLGIITSGGHYIETAPDDFQPIPLAPEILEKNGFEADEPEEEDSAYRLKKEGVIIVECFPVRDGFRGIFAYGCTRMRITIQFVHELQHALRLCGIEKEIEL